MIIDISKASKAKVLAALYNASRPKGLGWFSFTPDMMTEETAQKLLDDDDNPTKYFDYLKGRVMKIGLSHPTFLNARLYDRDNGYGAALAALKKAGLDVAPAIREEE
jgi:hypothetical protein